MQGAPRRAAARDRRAQRAARRHAGAVAAREGAHRADPRGCSARSKSSRNEEERARRAGDLGKAAEIHYGSIPELEQQLEAKRKELAQGAGEGRATSRKKSPTRTSPRSSPSGRASRSARCSRARCRSFFAWRKSCASASSGRTRRSRRSPTPSAARARGSATSAARSGRSCSSGPRASARPSSRARSPSSCSTTSAR